MLSKVWLILLLYISLVQPYWWKIGNINLKDITVPTVTNLHKFSRKQRLLLETTPKLLKVIGAGASVAIKECKRQFQNRKWNCADYSSESVFGKILDKAYRETSFIYAITSAGVTYALTESCARGFVKECHCHQGTGRKVKENNNWIYEGCHDNIQFGYHQGKDFVDATETSRDFNTMVNLHNNEAGRLAVMNSMIVQCKCHGVSGNCNVRTCRKSLPMFNEVGRILKELYDTATKVQLVQLTGNHIITRDNLQPTDSFVRRPTKKDLVYIEESPDFCKPDIRVGSLGTQGRYCNASIRAKGVDGCHLLCCGRDWETKEHTTLENCKCRFIWCCEVVCQKCHVTREYSSCK